MDANLDYVFKFLESPIVALSAVLPLSDTFAEDVVLKGQLHSWVHAATQLYLSRPCICPYLPLAWLAFWGLPPSPLKEHLKDLHLLKEHRGLG